MTCCAHYVLQCATVSVCLSVCTCQGGRVVSCHHRIPCNTSSLCGSGNLSPSLYPMFLCHAHDNHYPWRGRRTGAGEGARNWLDSKIQNTTAFFSHKRIVLLSIDTKHSRKSTTFELSFMLPVYGECLIQTTTEWDHTCPHVLRVWNYLEEGHRSCCEFSGLERTPRPCTERR